MHTKLNIIIFAFNRPKHLLNLFSSIKGCNTEGLELFFYIHIDGPRNKHEAKYVADVVMICEEFSKANTNVEIIKLDENKGLAQSIFYYTNEVSKKVKHFIVLEDDLELHKGFFKFMSNSLSIYEKYENVWHINGWSFPNIDNGLNTYFSPQMSSWGWATWSNKWENLIRDDEIILNSMNKTDIHDFNIWGYHNFWRHFQLNHKGKMRTWAIYWYLSIHLKKAICVSPPRSLVNNIGNDFSGTNSRNNPIFENNLEWDRKIHFDTEVKVNTDTKAKLIEFYSNRHFSFFARGYRFLMSKFRKLINIKYP